MNSPTTKKTIYGRGFGIAHDLNRRRNAQRLMSTLALLLALILYAPAAIAQHSTTTHVNGAFASAAFFSPNEFGFVFVSRAQSQGSGTTFLFYEHAVFDPNNGTVTERFGSGIIPDSAFEAQVRTASLNVDTSQIAGFDNQFCIFDPNSGITCTPATGGVVNAKWSAVPSFKFQFTGTSKSSSPGVKFIFTGTQEETRALADLSLLGNAVTNVDGGIGTNHNTSITVQHP